MNLYRVTYAEWAGKIESSGIGGRWDISGKNIMYTSGSPSLGLLEFLANQDILGDAIYLTTYLIPQTVEISGVDFTKFPPKWYENNYKLQTKQYGEGWALDNRKEVLKVPSVIFPFENNYLINILNKEFVDSISSSVYKINLDNKIFNKWIQ